MMPKVLDKRSHAQATRAISGMSDALIHYGDNAAVGELHELIIPDVIDDGDKQSQTAALGQAHRLAFLERYAGTGLVRLLQAENQTLAAQIVMMLETAQTDEIGRRHFAGTHQDLQALEEADARKYIPLVDMALGQAYVIGLLLKGTKANESLQRAANHYKKYLPKLMRQWVKNAPTLDETPKQRWQSYRELLNLMDIDVPPEMDAHMAPDDSDGGYAEDGEAVEEEISASTAAEDAEKGDLASATGSEGVGAEEAQMDEGQGNEQAGPRPQTFGDSEVEYQIYTREFDQTIPAQRLVTRSEWSALQERFVTLTRNNKQLARRLSSRLKAYLKAQHTLDWAADQEEGFVDSMRLAPFVAGGDDKIYKQLVPQQKLDTAVTILVDNSGSMRGRPIEMAAFCTNTLATTLEQCGVVSEVLGFSTSAWKGGRARRKWLTEGRPENPGRLNELLLTVYKPFTKSMALARKNFPAMLADENLKENIDGESLEWAYGRLLKRRENRKILVVISDGAPVDYATDRHNPAGYLDRHLRQVIEKIEHGRQVELLAIGIGHDVRRYYHNAVTIHNPDQLGEVLVEKVLRLFKK